MAMLVSSNDTEILAKLVFVMEIQGLMCQAEMVPRKLFTEWHMRKSSYSGKDNRKEKAFNTRNGLGVLGVFWGSGRPGVVGDILGMAV